MKIVLNIVFSILPEVLFFTLFLIKTKDLKDKKFRLFMLLAVDYAVYIMLNNYKILNYVSFIILTYVILKLLYKEKAQIIDVFVISYAFLYVSLLAYISFLFIQNNMNLYYIFYILDRILLFVPFIFKNRFNKIYKRYCKYWNRNDKANHPIKSITLRNVSLIIVNLAVFLLNIAILNIT